MKFTATDKFLFIGRSGCGKSFLAKKMQLIYPRRVIFDSMEEYDHDGKPNTVMVFNFTEFTQAISNLRDEKRFTIIYRIDSSEELSTLYFDNAMFILYELGNVCVVIEEVQDYCSPHKIPASLKKGMTSGRHRNMAFFMTTQRPSFIHGDIFSQATNIFCGNLIKKSDAQTMADLLNLNRQEISTLQKRQFYWFNSDRPQPTIKINSDNLIKS